MAKKKKVVEPSLEDKFVVACKKDKLDYCSRLFAVNDSLFLPDFVFKSMIVVVAESISVRHLEIINKFKKAHPDFRMFLLTNDQGHCLDAAKEFDEVFNFASVGLLLKEIRKGLDNKPK